MKLPSILNNKYVLYGLIILEISQLILYLMAKQYKCVFFVLAISYSVYCKYKNKSLAILTSLFFTNVIYTCKKVVEGWEANLSTCKKVSVSDITKPNNKDKPADHPSASNAAEKKERAKKCIKKINNCGECAPDLTKNPKAVRRWL